MKSVARHSNPSTPLGDFKTSVKAPNEKNPFIFKSSFPSSSFSTSDPPLTDATDSAVLVSVVDAESGKQNGKKRKRKFQVKFVLVVVTCVCVLGLVVAAGS